MKLFTKKDWEALWEPFQNSKLSLSEHAKLMNSAKAKRQKEYPGVIFSNARYAAHVENWLAENAKAIPAKVLLDLKPEDIRFDWQAFPHLAPLLGYKPLSSWKKVVGMKS
jgi:hypothetical protein